MHKHKKKSITITTTLAVLSTTFFILPEVILNQDTEIVSIISYTLSAFMLWLLIITVSSLDKWKQDEEVESKTKANTKKSESRRTGLAKTNTNQSTSIFEAELIG